MFSVLTVLFLISSIFSYLNAKWIRLPGVIGVMLLAVITSILTLIIGKFFPEFCSELQRFTVSFNFSKTLLDIMLEFLLFASALHFDVSRIRENLRGILITSTFGVILSTFLFGGMLYLLLSIMQFSIPLIYCLLFGALVSPTDAVAVSALLKKSKIPVQLKTIISGESLFNDGIGLVLFVTFLEIIETPGKSFLFKDALLLFTQEVFGGLIAGLSAGWIVARLMRSVNDFQTVILLSVTLVMSLSAIGHFLHLSIPLAEVSAGLLINSSRFGKGVDLRTSGDLEKIWKLIDGLLNTVLFVMMGLQMVSMEISSRFVVLGLLAIALLLLSRLLSIVVSMLILKKGLKLHYQTIMILTWGGLGGGISIALALSIPGSPYRAMIVTGSFFIVFFSVIAQGLTISKVANRLLSS